MLKVKLLQLIFPILLAHFLSFGECQSQNGTKKQFLYFAYGSNMWSERIKINNPNVVKFANGFLSNYRLDFAHYSKKWEGAVANIMPDSRSVVHGILWKLQNLKALDKQEGVGIGIYERLKVKVRSHGEHYEAWTYQVTEKAKKKAIDTYGPNLRPSREYKDTIIRGALEHSLPRYYVDQLKQIHVNKGYQD